MEGVYILTDNGLDLQLWGILAVNQQSICWAHQMYWLGSDPQWPSVTLSDPSDLLAGKWPSVTPQIYWLGSDPQWPLRSTDWEVTLSDPSVLLTGKWPSVTPQVYWLGSDPQWPLRSTDWEATLSDPSGLLAGKWPSVTPQVYWLGSDPQWPIRSTDWEVTLSDPSGLLAGKWPLVTPQFYWLGSHSMTPKVYWLGSDPQWPLRSTDWEATRWPSATHTAAGSAAAEPSSQPARQSAKSAPQDPWNPDPLAAQPARSIRTVSRKQLKWKCIFVKWCKLIIKSCNIAQNVKRNDIWWNINKIFSTHILETNLKGSEKKCKRVVGPVEPARYDRSAPISHRTQLTQYTRSHTLLYLSLLRAAPGYSPSSAAVPLRLPSTQPATT